MRRGRLLPLVVIFSVVLFIMICQGCGKDKSTYITFGKPFIVNVGSQKAFLSAEIVVKVMGKLKNKEERKTELQAALVDALVRHLKDKNPKEVTPEGLRQDLIKDQKIQKVMQGINFDIQFTRFVMQ